MAPVLRQGTTKNYFRLIRVFLSTEIFSKRRKIYSTIEEKPEYRMTIFISHWMQKRLEPVGNYKHTRRIYFVKNCCSLLCWTLPWMNLSALFKTCCAHALFCIVGIIPLILYMPLILPISYIPKDQNIKESNYSIHFIVFRRYWNWLTASRIDFQEPP